jgi:hypothetical protein
MQNLSFTLIGRSDSGLTQIWEVTSVHTGVNLGKISWYAAWRRYAFYPSPSLFDADCLQEIAAFLREQMQVRAQDRQLR